MLAPSARFFQSPSEPSAAPSPAPAHRAPAPLPGPGPPPRPPPPAWAGAPFRSCTPAPHRCSFTLPPTCRQALLTWHPRGPGRTPAPHREGWASLLPKEPVSPGGPAPGFLGPQPPRFFPSPSSSPGLTAPSSSSRAAARGAVGAVQTPALPVETCACTRTLSWERDHGFCHVLEGSRAPALLGGDGGGRECGGVSCGPLGPLPHQPTPLRIRFTKNPGATRRCRLQGACRVSHVIRSGPRGRGGLCRVLGAPLSVDRPSPFKVSSS